jgi:hypothetical protein
VEGLAFPGRKDFTFCRPSGHGVGIPGRASPLLRLAAGALTPPQPTRLFPGREEGVLRRMRNACCCQRPSGCGALYRRSLLRSSDLFGQSLAGAPPPDSHVVLSGLCGFPTQISGMTPGNTRVLEPRT